ncbi:hypothetical protein MM817_03072 [Acidibacillus sp. S0AB]|uniref:Uncharacterized protein n=1 Tax=Sulfoacidibacillus ferrooxidans TaxID=2005001 RepID=A0A9X1VCH6_9BACL|nr:hypothetical protein [Sulfoacidibacillus ferrooxidans]
MVNTSEPHINRVTQDKRNTMIRLCQKASSRNRHSRFGDSQFHGLSRDSGHLNTSEMGCRRNKASPMGSVQLWTVSGTRVTLNTLGGRGTGKKRRLPCNETDRGRQKCRDTPNAKACRLAQGHPAGNPAARDERSGLL